MTTKNKPDSESAMKIQVPYKYPITGVGDRPGGLVGIWGSELRASNTT